jgi:hypothetical protein
MTTSWCSVGAYPERYAASMTTSQQRSRAAAHSGNPARTREKRPGYSSEVVFPLVAEVARLRMPLNSGESSDIAHDETDFVRTPPSAAPRFFVGFVLRIDPF